MKKVFFLLLLYASFCGADCSRELSLLDREVNRDQQRVAAIFKEARCPLRRLPSAKRIIDRLWAVKTGRVDLISAATPLPERLEFAQFSIPYDSEKIVLLGQAEFVNSLQLQSLNDVLQQNITLIGPLSGYFGPEWEKLRASFQSRKQLVDYSNWLSGAAALLRQPRSLMMITGDAAEEAIARSPKKLIVHPLVLYQTDVVLMFSRKTVAQSDIDELNAAIRRLLARDFAPL